MDIETIVSHRSVEILLAETIEMNQIRINEDYVESINRVLKFIDNNLDSELSVAQLGEIALFSKYHFHRVFKGAVGESLNAYVIRRRLERAMFLFKRMPSLSVTEVALKVGFNSPEHFSRSFKDKFGVTAHSFRRGDSTDPESLKNSKMYQEVSQDSFYNVYEQSREMESAEFSVFVREQPEFNVAFVSDTFGEDGTNLIDAYVHLMDWAKSCRLNLDKETQFAISRDDIEITPAEQYRMEFCISAAPSNSVGGKVGRQLICGGPYALIHVQGDIHQVAQAWDYLYKQWLPRSGQRPKDEPAVEIFLKDPSEIGWELFDLEIGIPLARL